MTAPIEDVSALPGKELHDQGYEPIGTIKEIYAINGDGKHPMWVSVEASFEEGENRLVLVPLARIKEEDGDLLVPYSLDHIRKCPESDDGDEISSGCEEQLRAHYGIGRGDGELRTDNFSYATLVPEEEGPSKRVDPEEVETPSADRRTEETEARLHDPGPREIRKVTASDVIDEGKERSKDDNDRSEDGGGSEGRSENEDAHEEESAREDEE